MMLSSYAINLGKYDWACLLNPSPLNALFELPPKISVKFPAPPPNMSVGWLLVPKIWFPWLIYWDPPPIASNGPPKGEDTY